MNDDTGVVQERSEGRTLPHGRQRKAGMFKTNDKESHLFPLQRPVMGGV